MARQLASFLVLLVMLMLTPPTHAQTAMRKAGRGLAGMTTSVLEVPGNMVAETRTQGAGVGIPLGFVKGLGMIVVRTLVGVYEFVTAPLPAPSNYRPILRPEFPWDYFSGGSSAPPPPPERPRRSRTHTP
jgi:putative exosortase-associated protein (TIGR04073 family)